jgi:hypothetical protein
MADLDPVKDDDIEQPDPHCVNCGELEEDCDCEEFEPDDVDSGDDDSDDDEFFDEDEDDLDDEDDEEED